MGGGRLGSGGVAARRRFTWRAGQPLALRSAANPGVEPVLSRCEQLTVYGHTSVPAGKMAPDTHYSRWRVDHRGEGAGGGGDLTMVAT